MKASSLYRSLAVLPFCVLLSGCGSNNSAGTSTPGTGSQVSAAAPEPEATEAAPTYKIVSEAAAGMPPRLVQELPKVAVPPPPDTLKIAEKPIVVFTTSKGNITVELNAKEAPLHAKSFVYLAGRKFFDGTTIHRYEPGFVIQGGDPLTRQPRTREFAGLGGPGYQIPREYNTLKHGQYVLAAARSADPDSAGSQFYFTLAPTPGLDYVPGSEPGYTVFGKTLKGQDVIAKLRKHDVVKSVVLQK